MTRGPSVTEQAEALNELLARCEIPRFLHMDELTLAALDPATTRLRSSDAAEQRDRLLFALGLWCAAEAGYDRWRSTNQAKADLRTELARTVVALLPTDAYKALMAEALAGSDMEP